MATVRINDDAIWIRHIENGEHLVGRLREMSAGEVLDLEVDGIVGKWQRMRDGSDGRPTFGIKPIADMRDVWKRLRLQSGRRVEIREVMAADTYLASVGATLSEWDSPEDEAAYGDL